MEAENKRTSESIGSRKASVTGAEGGSRQDFLLSNSLKSQKGLGSPPRCSKVFVKENGIVRLKM